MHLQTQPTQVFTVFGSYVLEGDGDYFPLNSGRSNSQYRCDTGKMELADALPEAARQVALINDLHAHFRPV
jgi:hypothetical protein